MSEVDNLRNKGHCCLDVFGKTWGSNMEHWDEGVYAIRGRGADGAIPLILSAGVHGDETAPAQVLESLQQQLLQRKLIPQRPVLLIAANPQALLNGKRYMKTNLNRLFG